MHLSFLSPSARRSTSFGPQRSPRHGRSPSTSCHASRARSTWTRCARRPRSRDTARRWQGATYLDRFFPLLTTAAGTIRPAKVLVMGVGVAGLQAIATAKRLGAKVRAYDVRIGRERRGRVGRRHLRASLA